MILACFIISALLAILLVIDILSQLRHHRWEIVICPVCDGGRVKGYGDRCTKCFGRGIIMVKRK
jgi:hypothetical protein